MCAITSRIDYLKDGWEAYDNVHFIYFYTNGIEAKFTCLTTIALNQGDKLIITPVYSLDPRLLFFLIILSKFREPQLKMVIKKKEIQKLLVKQGGKEIMVKSFSDKAILDLDPQDVIFLLKSTEKKRFLSLRY